MTLFTFVHHFLLFFVGSLLECTFLEILVAKWIFLLWLVVHPRKHPPIFHDHPTNTAPPAHHLFFLRLSHCQVNSGGNR